MVTIGTFLLARLGLSRYCDQAVGEKENQQQRKEAGEGKRASDHKASLGDYSRKSQIKALQTRITRYNAGMPSSQLVQALNEQIGHEFAASQQYVLLAAWYDSETLPQSADFFYRQAVEERNHAMMLLKYLLDTDSEVAMGEIVAPRYGFGDITEPVALALEQERTVSQQICELTRMARDDNDFASEQFLGWFLKEQVEEVASMSALLDVATRSQERPEELESYLARSDAEGEDPTAPPAAGGAL